MTTSTAPSDTDLLRQLRAGTAAAFEALYLRHQGPLFRFALLRCGSADTAADVVQEVFMGLLTGSFNFDPLRGLLQNFLFGVARNLVMKHESPRQRQRRRCPTPDDDDADAELEAASDAAEPLARMLGNEQAEDVRRALALLPPHYRDVVILYEMHDLSYLEIADICQVDIGTVRSRLSRGRAALAKRLAAHRPATIPTPELRGTHMHTDDTRDPALPAPFDALRQEMATRNTPPGVKKELMAAFASPSPAPLVPAIVADARWGMAGGIGSTAAVLMVFMLALHGQRAARDDAGAPLIGRDDSGAAFIALASFDRIEQEPAPRVVEATVPRTALASLGVPVSPENAGDAVHAEMLVGFDGRPLALRLASE